MTETSGPHQIICREMTADDLATVYEITRKCALSASQQAEGPPRAFDAWQDAFLRFIRSEKDTVVVAESDQSIVGYVAMLVPQTGIYAHNATGIIEVDPAHQNTRIGIAMVKAMRPYAEAKGIERIEARVRSDNTRAISFYASFGFQRAGLRTRAIKLHDGSYVDEVIMELFADEALDRKRI